MRNITTSIIFISCLFLTNYFSVNAFAQDPVPDIKANGVNNSIAIGTSDTLSITVSLSAGSSSGVDSDWWVAESAPDGWYYYSLSSWVNSGSSPARLSPTHQGALFDLNTHEVLNTSGLPEGTYTFYFGIDTNKNGSLDMGQLYYDFVEVIVVSSMVDGDGDGYNANEAGGNDCDDADATVNPGATEIKYNGKDDDCNPATLDNDSNNEGERNESLIIHAYKKVDGNLSSSFLFFTGSNVVYLCDWDGSSTGLHKGQFITIVDIPPKFRIDDYDGIVFETIALSVDDKVGDEITLLQLIGYNGDTVVYSSKYARADSWAAATIGSGGMCTISNLPIGEGSTPEGSAPRFLLEMVSEGPVNVTPTRRVLKYTFLKCNDVSGYNITHQLIVTTRIGETHYLVPGQTSAGMAPCEADTSVEIHYLEYKNCTYEYIVEAIVDAGTSNERVYYSNQITRMSPYFDSKSDDCTGKIWTRRESAQYQ